MDFQRALVGVVLSLSLAGAALAQDDPAPPPPADIATGVIGAQRVATLVCDVINKSEDPIDILTLDIKRSDGTVFSSKDVAPAWPDGCSQVPSGASCTLAAPVEYPENDVDAYCHARVPGEAFVRGGLRFEDRNGNTLAESDMKSDLRPSFEKIAEALETEVECTHEASGDLSGLWSSNTLNHESQCPVGQVALSPGWQLDDPNVLVQSSHQKDGEPGTWVWRLRYFGNSSGESQELVRLHVLCCERVEVIPVAP